MHETIIDNPVLKNIMDFFKKNNQLMNFCYSELRDDDNERILNPKISEIDNDTFDNFFPIVSTVILTANKFECDALNCLA